MKETSWSDIVKSNDKTEKSKLLSQKISEIILKEPLKKSNEN